MFLRSNLLLHFHFHQHLAKQFDTLTQKIGVFMHSYLVKVLFQCYSWFGHLVPPYFGFAQPYGSTG
jgi:hypothetical protein